MDTILAPTMTQQTWKKLGRVFAPESRFDWMQSYATTPTPVRLTGDIYRIFFSTRNALNQNQVGFVDINIHDPHTILRLSEQPVLSLGDLGTFDCDGIYATSIIHVDGKLYCYYAGWNAGLRGLFYSSIGVAISNDMGETFEKYTSAPILTRDKFDKWAVMAPFVIKQGPVWRMWFASGIKLYLDETQTLKSMYDIKYAESHDGLHWNKTGIVSIDLGTDDTNIARACVCLEDGVFKAWYPVVSRKTGRYRIGYAESTNGVTFERLDHLVRFEPSPSGWDSAAVAYPFVFRHEEKQYMLYNGNNFGKEGFGLAVHEY